MNMLRISCFVIALLCAVAIPTSTLAQTSLREAAKALYAVSYGDKVAASVADTILRTMTSGGTIPDGYKKAVHQWCNEVFSSSDYMSEMIDLYIKYYSEEEMRQLTKFYQSELGKKELAINATIIEEGSSVASKYAVKYQDRLVELLRVELLREK